MRSDLLTPVKPVINHLDLIESYMVTGCDERIYPDANGNNRYGINPVQFGNLVHRGSCTCGTLNEENILLMDGLLDKNLADTRQYEELLASQTRQLKELINYEGQDRFEVFYAPSGSDLAYYPILFGMILHPDRPVLNIVSCPEELGSGTLHAVKGQYHAGFNQFEERVPQGHPISPGLQIHTLFLNARGRDGKIINHEAYIKEQIRKHPDHSVIVSLVYGSKSGIEDNLDLIEKVDRPDIIWSVDMCQFRHSRRIIHRLLDRNACVMITGSKFYQAPPFCGCLLVSNSFMSDLVKGRVETFAMMRHILSGYDIPSGLRGRVGIPLRQNIGLRLRWACSLNEIGKFRKIPKDLVREKIEEWNSFILDRLESSPAFEPMPDQRITNKTIISFRVLKDGQYLDHQHLKELFRLVVSEGRLGGGQGKKVFIGQPVAYGSKSFLRVAIGSMCIREFIASGESDFKEDAEILNLIESKIGEVETTH